MRSSGRSPLPNQALQSGVTGSRLRSLLLLTPPWEPDGSQPGRPADAPRSSVAELRRLFVAHVRQIIAIATAGMIDRIASDAISIARKITEFNEPTSVDSSAPEGTSPLRVARNFRRQQQETPSQAL